ncbi:SPOR domain-containing protein [Burkholderia gladioli]|uniref:SPOR domain-containing protein n=1 Tax=Burkholderia gladioli TaxID=28095 RepID=UPI000D00E959|nr:SPOR domain-containing protein [Burkholderia gladioli]PRG48474.1 sporulation protein [Burkholderia gladioli]
MGIFSFGKKKDDDAPSRRGSKSGSRAVRSERVERRTTRRAERPSDAMMLDPTLPEKQRARRRLVGAIALVVAAVIVLPMILDSHPKPVTDDIAIDIPNKPAHAAPSRDEDPVDTQAGVAHDEPPVSGAADDTQTAQSATSPDSSDSKADVAPPRPAQQQAAQQASQQAAAKPAAPAPKPAAAAAQPPARAAAANGASPSQPAGARFAVQLGSFSDEATARGWADKLKAAGVPAYVEHRKQADGSATTLLRAGPFADRAAASAAIAKVRDAGLTQ